MRRNDKQNFKKKVIRCQNQIHSFLIKNKIKGGAIIAFSGGQALANVSYSGKVDELYGYDPFATDGGIAFYMYGNCSITV